MDGSAERYGESSDVFAYTILSGLLEGDRNCSCRGLGAESCEISRHHVPEEPERILAARCSCDAELQDEDRYMYEEDDSYDLDEDSKDAEYLSYICHIEEYTEDVKREEGNDGRLDCLYYDFLKIVCCLLQSVFVE